MAAQAGSSSGRTGRTSAAWVPLRIGPTASSSGSEAGLIPSRRGARLRRLVTAGRPAGGQPRELGLHEGIEVTVQNGPCAGGLVARPQVLDHLVGMQDVAADLVAPAGRDVLALELPDLFLLLLQPALQQARLEDLDRGLLVLRLGPLVLALGNDAGRQVGQAYGRVGLVDVLPAGTLRSERVDPDLVPVELHVRVVHLDLRQDLDERKRGLATILRVERADPDQPVDSPLGAQPAVGPAALHHDGRALDAGLLALEPVDDLGRETVPLR